MVIFRIDFKIYIFPVQLLFLFFKKKSPSMVTGCKFSDLIKFTTFWLPLHFNIPLIWKINRDFQG